MTLLHHVREFVGEQFLAGGIVGLILPRREVDVLTLSVGLGIHQSRRVAFMHAHRRQVCSHLGFKLMLE
jgi:hypothetical protein